MKLTPPLLLGALAISLGTGACKSLNTDLGRNVYERELEDSFDDEPAGVVGTTPDTRLVIFRENSFVAEPRPEGEVLGKFETAPESSQGLRLFREAAFRLAEARANSIEGMLALSEAGMSNQMIAQLFPSREDWSSMYIATLELSREAIMAEFEAGTRGDELGMELEISRLEAEVDLRSMELDAEAGDWIEEECDAPDDGECEEVPTLEGTSMTPRASQAWKIKYSSPELAGQTVDLVVTCLDARKSKHTTPTLTATFTVELNKNGKASFKADLPKRWRLVRLEGPGAEPLFAVFL